MEVRQPRAVNKQAGVAMQLEELSVEPIKDIIIADFQKWKLNFVEYQNLAVYSISWVDLIIPHHVNVI